MTVEALAASLERSRETITRLEPNPAGPHDKAAVSTLIQAVKRELIEALPAALADAAENNRPAMRDAVIVTALDTAGLAIAAGDDDGARRLLREIRGLAAGTSSDVEVGAASDAPQAFAWLTYGRWLHGKKKYGKAERALHKAAKLIAPASAAASSSTPNPSGASATVRPAASSTLADLIEQALDAPRPIDSVPGLTTVNGIGQALHGKRDVWSDGSYVTTLWFTILFCPVIPLSSFRVMSSGDSYRFFFGTRLSAFARWWRRGIGAATVATVALIGGSTWWASPDRLFGVAVADAESLASTDVDGAIRALGAALMTYPAASSDTRDTAAVKALAWREQTLPKPLTQEGLVRLMRDASLLPVGTRVGWNDPIATALEAWLADHGTTPIDDRLALVSRAAAAFPGANRIAGLRDALEIESINASSATWPAMAADRLSRLPGSAAVAGIGAIVRQAPSPGALDVVAGPANRYVTKGTDTDGVAAVSAKLTALAARTAERAPLLEETATLAAKKAWLRTAPDDQVVAAAVANAAFEAGDLAGAEQVLLAAGPAGWWNADLLDVGSALAQEKGDLGRASLLLERAVAPRIAEFAAATEGLGAQYRRIEDSVYSRANAGTLSKSVMDGLKTTDEDAQRAILNDVIQAEVTSSTAVDAARARVSALGPVVSQSLRLGTLKLRLAATAPAAEQASLLKASEDAFLAVAAFAGDDARFQLGLGEVKYRTQQADEGRKLLDAVVAQGNLQLSLSAAHVFRSVGADEPARETAQKVLDASGTDKANGAVHDGAAHLLLLLSTTMADQERYMALIHSTDDTYEAMRASLRADHFINEGKIVEADRELAKEAAIYEKDAVRDSAAANNASLAWSRRFNLTGDPKALQKATLLLQTARKLEPTSAIVAANLWNLEAQNAVVALMAPHVNVPLLEGSVGPVAVAARRPMPGGAPSLSDQMKQRTSGNARFRNLAEEVRSLAPTSLDAYGRLLGVYGHIDDEAGLRQLAQNMEKNPIDASQAKTMWEDRADPVAVGRSRTRLERELARLQALTPRDKNTQGAVALLEANVLDSLGRLDRDEARVQAAIDAWSKAETLWPVLDTRPERSSAMTVLAILRAQKTSPELALLIKDEPFFDDQLIGLVLTDAQATAGAALAARPEVAAALALRSPEPSSRAWALARLLHNAEAERTHVTAIQSPANRLYWELRAKLSPWSPYDAAWASLAKGL